MQFCLWFPPGTSTDRWLRDTNSHSVNPPSLHLFQHPPAFLLLLLTKQRNVQDLSALLSFYFLTPPHSLHPPGRTFFTVNSTLVPTDTSVELMILGLSIFSLFFPPSFFSSTSPLCVYLIAFCGWRSAFLSHAASAQENAYSRANSNAVTPFEECFMLVLGLCTGIFTNSLADTREIVFLLSSWEWTYRLLWVLLWCSAALQRLVSWDKRRFHLISSDYLNCTWQVLHVGQSSPLMPKK